ncbi:hypothetical protein [Croceivirga thetidis]|uniref:Uncharacterized protein n=1 Tax=Croceivirga thetidis TaxID=2721623 RepID=A0ABX1GUN6_9FLAO|nr:hypothetical protein [Croceivirga thetidis]NKI33349.1 hypothetical protein [Croceivirga thetidis]
MGKFITKTAIHAIAISVCILLQSCDPVGDLDVTIENASSQNLQIQWYSNLEEYSYSKTIEQGSSQLIEEQGISDIGGLPTEPYYKVFDSVSVFTIQNQLLKTWKPNTPSKNIFNTSSDWELRTTGKWEAKAKFVIEESDL